MASLRGFPDLPGPNDVTVCEVNGMYCCANKDFVNIQSFTNSINNHPQINVTRDFSYTRDEVLPMYLEVEDNLLKRITSVWYKQGFIDALKLAADTQINRDSPLIAVMASYILKVTNAFTKAHHILQPHLKDIGPKMIAKYSHTRDWSNSTIRCIAWHPHTTKLSVASADDNIRVYSSDNSLVCTLKCNTQINVSSMAWRPYSASELAVGCETGVIIWTVDPNSIFTKPSSSNALLLKRSGHTPVTNVSWSPNGDVLISTSAADCSMLVWDVATEAAIPIRRVAGGGVAFSRWSPDASKLFTASACIIFRVWDSRNKWTAERWCTRGGRVVAACWSAQSVLLFAAEGEPVVYALKFENVNLFAGDKNIPNKANPALDVSKIEVNTGDALGGPILDMRWDPKGRHLAITFVESPLVAIFTTSMGVKLQITPCCLVRGINTEIPNVIAFQENFAEGACLTIGWSSGRIQYFPIVYTDIQ